MGPAVNAAIPAPLLDLYEGQPARVRAHIRTRWRTCPFPAVAALVPATGRILDFGSGHGLLASWLALRSSARTVVGVDVDPNKIASARQAAARARSRGLPAAEFRVGASSGFPSGPWDAVLFVDVLYLLDPAGQERALRDAARALAPGGAVLVKETSRHPRWKAAWAEAQEFLAVRILRITAGAGIRFLAPATYAGWLEAEGLAVVGAPADRGYLHPHHLLAARRGAAVGSQPGGNASEGTGDRG
ncbi:MAG: class I SAM-dependent methyltransferase [Acidobacteriota bacterium]